jgi:hypothetical protein
VHQTNSKETNFDGLEGGSPTSGKIEKVKMFINNAAKEKDEIIKKGSKIKLDM